MPTRLRSDAYSACRSRPSNFTAPFVGCQTPTSTFNSVDLPEPEGPITAVSVPGRDVRDTRSSSVTSPSSIVRPTSRASRPPVVAAGSVRRTRSATREDEVDVADRDDVVLLQRLLLDAFAIDERAVDVVGILDLHARRRRHQSGVVPRRQHV